MANRYLVEAQQLLRSGQFMAAAELCGKSIKLRKDTAAAKRLLADCHYNLGVFHSVRTGLLEAAETEFRRALEINPNHADASNNLGALFLMKGLSEQSLDYFRRAVKAKPKDPRYLTNLARNLRRLNMLSEASSPLLALADIDPDNNGAYLLSEAMLVAEIIPDDEYPLRIRQEINKKLEKLLEQDLRITTPLSFPATYFLLSYHGVSNLDLVKKLAAIHLKWCPSLGWSAPHVAHWKGPQGKTKIGLASRFFRNHSIGNTSRGLVEMLDRERFEVIVIRFEPSKGDETSLAIDRAADKVVTLPGDFGLARQTIAQLGLDILFYQDIGMEPLSYFLAFARLAPVQLTSFGHPDTTGIPNLDFFVSAKNYELPGAEREYSEQLIQIPDVGTLAYYHRPKAPGVKLSREDFGLKTEDKIYLCPQTLFKIQPIMDRIFQKIVDFDARAKFVLIESGHNSLRPALESRILRLAGRLRDHLKFISGLEFERYLGLVSCADVVLDTAHFNGQNTTLEAFALGIPVVTYPGSLQRSRHGYGMYKTMGFMDLVAVDENDYAEKATRVANDKTYREHCSNRISESCGVLFENRNFITHCQEAFFEMMRIRSHL
jgi:protein O-GlcNAc transferase